MKIKETKYEQQLSDDESLITEKTIKKIERTVRPAERTLEQFLVTLQGTRPGHLQNRMTEAQLLGLRDKTAKKSKTATKPSLEEEAESKIHRDLEGRAVIPRINLMSCLMGAGVFIRLDQKRQLSTKDSSLLPGLLFFDDESFPLLLPGTGEEATWGFAPWRYAVHGGRNPNGGEAVCIVRPMFERWAISFKVLLDTAELAEETFFRLFTLAGQRIGLGDWRPARKGTFGIFSVVRWQKLASDVDLAA